ncbi:hypothetical protein FRX31_017782 [Thalictrum thalictroides]|uniref:FBD domain-containing protein n=1 Tax=Thalictrum thalictroides TaxID=46969 RepID=A0A7J6W5I1_THATH|nr:hypothetical protein FRX31_017782 [Thalictrum thalictroides]
MLVMNDDHQFYVMKAYKFVEFVTKVLSLRDNSTIKCFHLCYWFAVHDNVISHETTDQWIKLIVRNNVEEVCLEDVDVVPSTLQCLGNMIKTLKLINAFVCSDHDYYPSDPDNDLIKLNLTCLTLENLIIEDSDDHLDRITIHGPCLTFLMIKNGTGLGYPLRAVADRELKICTPNLRQLYLKGGFLSDYSLKNLCSLDNAQVDTTVRHNDDNTKEYAVDDWCLNKLLKGLVHTKSLTLSADAFQEYRQSLTKEEGYSHNIFPKMKSVEIKGIDGTDEEFKFLKFVLKVALKLEKVTVPTRPTRALSKNALQKLAELYKKIQDLHRSSASVAMLLNSCVPKHLGKEILL